MKTDTHAQETHAMLESLEAPAIEDLTPAHLENLDRNIDNARKVETAVASITAKQHDFSRIIGQMQAVNLFKKMANTADVVLLRQIKESKQYKGMQVPQEDGTLRTLNTFEDFCEYIGTSRRKVDEDIQNLNTFGEEFMEASQKMGLGYRQLRQLRALPDDAKQIIIEGEKVNNDPEALKDLLEEMAARNMKTKDQLSEAKKDLDAREKLLDEKGKEINKVKLELAKLKNLTPDEEIVLKQERESEALKELHSRGFSVLGAFAAYLAQAAAIVEHPDATDNAAKLVTDLTGGLCSKIDDNLREVGIDIDFRIIAYPLMLDDDGLRGDAERAETEGE